MACACRRHLPPPTALRSYLRRRTTALIRKRSRVVRESSPSAAAAAAMQPQLGATTTRPGKANTALHVPSVHSASSVARTVAFGRGAAVSLADALAARHGRARSCCRGCSTARRRVCAHRAELVSAAVSGAAGVAPGGGAQRVESHMGRRGRQPLEHTHHAHWFPKWAVTRPRWTFTRPKWTVA